MATCLAFVVSCRQPIVLGSDANQYPQKLPFDRPPQARGISPSRSLLPAVTHIPEGTAVTVSLEHSLSSASAHSNDAFKAVLDDPIVIDGQTIVRGGTVVTGRVLDARSAASLHQRGYLRIALVSLNRGETDIPIATSSLFAKGGSREEHVDPISVVDNDASRTSAPKEIELTPGRRLTFRLTQNVDLQ